MHQLGLKTMGLGWWVVESEGGGGGAGVDIHTCQVLRKSKSETECALDFCV